MNRLTDVILAGPVSQEGLPDLSAVPAMAPVRDTAPAAAPDPTLLSALAARHPEIGKGQPT